MRNWVVAVAACAVVAAGFVASGTAAGAVGGVTTATGITLASGTSDGGAGNARSEDVWQSVTANGRYVVINSRATNMVPGVADHRAHLYVRDLETGKTTIADVSDAGVPGNGDSFGGTISANGRYVAFTSAATNLVPGDTGKYFDVFVRDMVAKRTYRISTTGNNQNGNAMSFRAEISGNGQYVAFTSLAWNLLPGITYHGSSVFVYDMTTHKLEDDSVSSSGAKANAENQAPTISDNGRYVGFSSQATNLVPGVTDGRWNVYVRDRLRHVTILVSAGVSNVHASDELPITAQGSLGSTLSPDGNYIGFGSWQQSPTGPDLGLFVHDIATGKTERVDVSSSGTAANGLTFFLCSISSGGRYVVFSSQATNLVSAKTNGTWNVYIRDLKLHTTRLISAGVNGAVSNGESAYPVISADGSTVVFMSAASNLVPANTGNQMNVYRWSV
jgi:TolB protein